jgi:hypothetical protein
VTFFDAYMVFDVVAGVYISDPLPYHEAELLMRRRLEQFTGLGRKAIYRIDAVTTNDKPE